MEIIDNINRLLGDDLKDSVASGARLRVAASTFSIFASAGQPLLVSVTLVPSGTVSRLQVTTVKGSSRIVSTWVWLNVRGGSTATTRPTMKTREPSSDL